ncbi:hypothetical protein OIU34_02315 [Pararhizobium sp. BT-229]|uniref:hypothetical protein n=1 Tax=Pararhizobium sp. BT-229 TaxID=2986923 RepID=UPI0021F77655|nr:hypothetical protein [Pararhizobium sp. BT-229]MCV9960721.1 hypothetical protein [Pararhizobium sp. BT-229]
MDFPLTANNAISFGSVTESVVTNSLGHLVQDVPEWVGKNVDMSCRAMRHKLTATALPAL